jgi:hypothetical protein
MPKRRSLGEGSVYQAKDGVSWVAQLDLGVDAQGKRHYRQWTFPTKRKATDALREMTAERVAGTETAAATSTLKDFLA